MSANRSVAIITARGGSKRIPRKNILPFCGKPILTYSITAARESNLFDTIMVSTDDNEIAEIAKKNGAVVPFIRSDANSDDHAGTADVVCEVLENFKSQGIQFTYACCIYPTAPFISGKILREAFELLLHSKFYVVMPVTRFSFPVQRSVSMESDGSLQPNWPEYMASRSQDLEPAFHDCGQFYFLKIEHFLKSRQLIGPLTGGIEIPEIMTQDIDTQSDWKLAEMKYRMLHKIDTTNKQ